MQLFVALCKVQSSEETKKLGTSSCMEIFSVKVRSDRYFACFVVNSNGASAPNKTEKCHFSFLRFLQNQICNDPEAKWLP